MNKESLIPIDGTVDTAEIEKFTAMAEEWWDTNGKFKPLHKLNPARLGFLRDRIAAHFGRDPMATNPLKDLTVLDIGCNDGILLKPLNTPLPRRLITLRREHNPDLTLPSGIVVIQGSNTGLL